MKLVRSVRLWMKEGTSDKIYEVDLVDLENAQVEDRFLVNFRYGRRGATLRDGTKTPSPVKLSSAEKLFDSVVISKVNDGYRRMGEEAAPASASGSGGQAPAGGRDGELLNQLAACLRSPWPARERDRLFWRIGVIRLEAAFEPLAALAEKLGVAEASYSLVHALARCGGGKALELLDRIAERNTSAVTRDYAAYALASVLMGEKRQPPRLALPQAANGADSRAIDAALAAADGQRLVEILTAVASGQPGFANQFLIALAHRALADAPARTALLAALGAVTARPPFVQVLRRLFKYADLTDDGPLYAATARQFELATPMYRHAYRGQVWVPGERKPLKLSEEQASPTPRVALSEQTLYYFKRRAWRSLRKRGELAQDAFTAMASELLLAFSDADGERAYEQQHFVQVDGRYQRRLVYYPALRRIWSLGQLLHRHLPGVRFRPNTLSFSVADNGGARQRDEAFPQLWDAQPQHLLRVAAAARNRPAALFAVQALQQGPERPPAVDAAAIPDLLASPYGEVQSLAVLLARRLIEAGKADPSLVAALMAADIGEAHQLAIQAIAGRADWPWSEPALALAVLLSPQERLQQASRDWLQQRPPSRPQLTRLTEDFAAWLGALPAEPDQRQLAGLRFALSLLPALWPGHDCPLPPAAIEALTGHKAGVVQGAAIELLAVTPIRPGELPQPFWDAVLDAQSLPVRAASMRLLARLDEAGLEARSSTILAAATSEHADLRAAARPLVARLAAQSAGFAEMLRDHLLDTLFRAEPSEGYAADMVELFATSLPDFLTGIDTSTLWRLLQARAKGARLLGTRALMRSEASRFSVKQVARLGNHAYAAVRAFAMRAFETDQARFQAAPEDAVLLVESEWDDVREPATRQLLAWPDGVLPAAALAVMADSTVPAVQECARQLLRRSLDTGDAATVLARVLEHPSASFHLFVTELITGQSLADAKLFETFLTQARIILMQINRGRIAKDRVFAALRREALDRHERASAIASLLHDLTLSAVAKDRAPALAILTEIARRWPDIALPIGLALASQESAA
ncbi:hypothetical protein [Labrys neptuniae]